MNDDNKVDESLEMNQLDDSATNVSDKVNNSEEELELENIESSDSSTELSEFSDELSDSESAIDEVDPDLKWYILKCQTNMENRVVKTLTERILNLKMSKSFGEIVVPEEIVVTNVNGKKRKLKKKLCPGYVFIQMILSDAAWHLLKNTDKISGFVGGSGTHPTPMTEEEAEHMLKKPSKDGVVRNVNIYSEGDQVKVTEGPFASFIGTVEMVNDKGKLKVNVLIFGRPTPVELDFSQVKKVE